MEIKQLELDLWQSLETAVKFPQTADFSKLCDALDLEIAPHSTREQLILVTEVITQLSQVYAARVELVFFDWQRRYNPTEPVVALEECVGLFVQSLHLDVADLFELPDSVQYPANRQPRSPVDPHDSLVGQVDKAVLLATVDQLSEEHLLSEVEFAEQLRQLAGEEDILKWQQAIALWMQQSDSKAISLMQLQRTLEIPLIEIWLGLLLGEQEH